MEKEFVSYNIALELQKLGFNEDCLAFYAPNLRGEGNILFTAFDDEYDTSIIINNKLLKERQFQPQIAVPLYQQAFHWFREKYNLYPEIKVEDFVKLENKSFYWSIFGVTKSFEGNDYIRCIKDSNGEKLEFYEEAELACLIELIKIVKQ